MLSNAMLSNAMLSNAMLSNTMLSNAMLSNAMLSNAKRCNAKRCNTKQCNAKQCKLLSSHLLLTTPYFSLFTDPTILLLWRQKVETNKQKNTETLLLDREQARLLLALKKNWPSGYND